MSEFTPGPWKQSYLSILGADGDSVAAISLSIYPDSEREWDEKMANARLIAAAPEMYEACQSTSAYFEMLETATNVAHPVLVELRAALARAKDG